MNYIRQKLHQKFAFLSELSIRVKIQLLVISSILVLSIISLGGTQMIIRKYNETLYQSVETSLSYSTKEISSYLDTIDNMADQILANKTLQESLASWSDASASLNSSTYNSLYQQITNYMMGSDGRFLSYMIIKQDTKTVYSSYLVSMETPTSMLDHLVDYAEQADGSVKVVSDYCNDSGLFMVRKIKESKNLSFRNLGYVLININIKELVNQALENKMSNDISYMLLENDQLLLAEGSFDESDLPKLRKTPQNGYSLYSKDGKTFFIVRTDIPKYNFNIIYSVPYSTIYAAISRETFLICAFVIAGIILVILFSTTITALLANDFKLLIHNMQLFASGKYTLTEQEQMLSSRKDEIGMLHKGFNDMAVEINDLIEKNYVNELLKKEAQLKTLESQMDPHFLYNTLDSINWRAKAIHADDISQICTSLGSLLRITLHKDMGNFTVGEEMHTDSLRCQLPENTNGTGYWKITIYGLGYADYSYNFEVGTENIATLKTASAEEIAALKDKIDEAKALNQSKYTTDSWKKMQDELEESEDLLKSENPLKSEVNEQVKHLTDAIDSLVKVQYVLMNIPYAEFYKAETTGNDIAVDAFTSATKNKTRTKGLAGGSYHEKADGSSIDGITYAVKVDSSVDLSKYKKVEDSDTVDITVTNRGQTSTTTLTGKDTLFENASYAYYPLSEIPANYKEVSLDADGNLVFSEVKGQEAKVVEGVTAELSTKSSYGDYELDLDGLPEEISSDSVNAVVIKTTDGTAYGMRHLENIWRGTELAWCTGFTESVHNCPTSSEHYKSMMGKTIDSIEYYTTNGLYTMDIEDIYVPVKADNTVVEVADADITAGKTKINVKLPDEFKPEYSVDGLDVSVEGNELTFKAATESRAAASVKPGKYTLTIKDKSKKYADVVTTFTLTTKDMPAAYDEENKKLVEAKGFDTDALKAYLGNITSVNVNGKDYAASGRGSVVIINKDGTIKTDADPFKDAVVGTEFQITVASTGYKTPLTFTYKIAETPAPAEVDTTALEAAIAEADNLKEADYTADSWSVYQAALQSARTALEAKESQDAVDQALAALNAAKDALVKAEEEPVAINTASLEKAIADAKALKEADYTADSWKALQSALSDARKALEAKESQEAVDNATNSLNKAIKALVKKGSSSVKKTDGTTNGSKTSGNDSVKTGDPASVLGWLGLAVSSLGAGMGGFAWKRRKRK